MSLALDILAILLLLAGLFLCGVNAFIAFRNLRADADRYVSPVPLIPGLMAGFGAALLMRGAEGGAGLLVIPFILLDLSLATLALLPFHLLLRALRGEDAPPLLPRELTIVFLIFYLAVMAFFAFGAGLGIATARAEAREASALHHDADMVATTFRLPAEDIRDVSFRRHPLHAGGDPCLPGPDAPWELEGCLRLAMDKLPAAGMPVLPPPTAEDSGAPSLTDWQEDAAFTQSLLRDGRQGRILFSPSTGWLYFTFH